MFEPDDATKPVETTTPSTGESKEGAVMESGSDPMPAPALLAHAAADHDESDHAAASAAEAPEQAATLVHAEPEVPPAPEPAVEEAPPENPKHWYVVKVQSGREDTIKEAIERRVRKENLEDAFGQIVIPVEKVTEVKVDKNGKRVPKTKERKLYPGYLMVEVEYNDRIVYLFRETSGVGDFVGSHPGNLMKPPTPMSAVEILRMLGPKKKEGDGEAAPVAKPPVWLQPGDRVRVVDGTFNGMDGNVKQILEAVSKVQVELAIFGRPVNVDFEYYQVEQV
jgi:transcription termination/antitermination protein NusG